MPQLEGQRVAAITGAGRGIGREHALAFARHGVAVVVNDLGGSSEGDGASAGPAQEVVDLIRSEGGQAVAVLAQHQVAHAGLLSRRRRR